MSTSRALDDLRAVTISSLPPGVRQFETNQAAVGRVLLTCKKCCSLVFRHSYLETEFQSYHVLFSVFSAEVSNFHKDFIISKVFFWDDFAVGDWKVRVCAVGHCPVEEVVPFRSVKLRYTESEIG